MTTNTTHITICGSNLNDRNYTFHVHAPGCADLKHYGPGTRNGGDDQGWTVEVQSDDLAFEAARAVYESHISDYGYEYDSPEAVEYWQSCVPEFRVYPCTHNQTTKETAKMATTKTKTEKAPKAEKPVQECPLCGCGCGARTARPKAKFLPGHDAKLKGQLLRAIRSGNATEAKQAEAVALSHGWDWLPGQASKTPVRKPKGTKAEPKVKTTKPTDPTKVRIGRWTYPLARIEGMAGSEFRVVYINKQGTEIEATVPKGALS